MWLLSTDRAELHYFARNFDAPSGYAILSHTWDGKEQTLQEVQVIIEQCRRDGTNPRDFVHPKIRNCCIVAEKHGYRWVWIDSCCIDKTSSSELSEAINSMFRWYKEAEVCFAYLADVPTDCDLGADDSAFRKSRWHTRGWTLQELIAPDFLIFLSNDWHELGNRADNAALLMEVTGIPYGVLTGEHQPAEYSVSIRMSWVSKRKTTRVEDEAYCLMGLFKVQMPTNYGEGKQAFIRLQYEIMQHNPDMSLFAFGGVVPSDQNFTLYPRQNIDHAWKYLMAESPRQFAKGCSYLPDLRTNAKQQYPPPLESEMTSPFGGGIELPRVAVTSYGVKLRVPIYEGDGLTIAVILCQLNGRPHRGLFLRRDSEGKDPKRPRYFTGCVHTRPGERSTRYVARLADLGDDLYNLTFNRKPVKASWRTIYVVPTISDLDPANSTTPNLIMNCNPASRFRVPRWLIAQFTALQFQVGLFKNSENLHGIYFGHPKMSTSVCVFLGVCLEHPNHKPDQPPLLWAKARVRFPFSRRDTYEHDCCEDHLDSESWATRSKVFGDADQEARLSLKPSTVFTQMPDIKFEIRLELLGRVFKETFPDSESLPIFSSLTDVEIATLRPALHSDPATSSQATPHRRSPSVPRTALKRGPDTPIPASEPKRRRLALDVDKPAPGGVTVAETRGQVEDDDSDG